MRNMLIMWISGISLKLYLNNITNTDYSSVSYVFVSWADFVFFF